MSEIKYEDIEIERKRDYLVLALRDMNISINGSLENRMHSNLNICVHDLNIDSQQLVSLLSMNNICVSGGSACNSGVAKPSHVLLAMGLNEKDASSSLRITLGHETTYEDIDSFVEYLKIIINMYKN